MDIRRRERFRRWLCDRDYIELLEIAEDIKRQLTYEAKKIETFNPGRFNFQNGR